MESEELRRLLWRTGSMLVIWSFWLYSISTSDAILSALGWTGFMGFFAVMSYRSLLAEKQKLRESDKAFVLKRTMLWSTIVGALAALVICLIVFYIAHSGFIKPFKMLSAIALCVLSGPMFGIQTALLVLSKSVAKQESTKVSKEQ